MNVGDKVVCVDFHRNEVYGEPPRLLPGVVYVVSEVGRWLCSDGSCEDYLNLVGVEPPYVTCGWRARRFRKLEELKARASRSQQQPAYK